MTSRRDVLSALTRARLLQVAQAMEVTGLSAERKEQVVEALVQSESVALDAVLGMLSRDELKAICRSIDIDDSGREKAAIADRIMEACRVGSAHQRENAHGQVVGTARPTGGTHVAKRKKRTETQVEDYRHEDATRKNNPPAKIAAEGIVPTVPKAQYYYSPRRPPVLRFDPEGGPDQLPDLLAEAKERPLTDEEAKLLAEALRGHQPWLEWTEKREQHERGFFDVDPVALHIHERISAQAILKVAKRQDVQRSLFADPEQEYQEAVQFYQHDIDWTNRLILGDSLQVMSSLARREDLAGKVQMIYMDPPYGIKFASNFQPEVGKRDVKDRDADLTREPEMVKAYRDTWHLGIHSYLSYLRDRLMAARDLLADSGSIFVQISDENLHRVRQTLDEVFGPENFCSVIGFMTTTGKAAGLLDSTFDFLLWYAKDRDHAVFHQTYVSRGPDDDQNLRWVELASGVRRRASSLDDLSTLAADEGSLVFRPNPLTSQSGSDTTIFDHEFESGTFRPKKGGWKTNAVGMSRLHRAGRLLAQGNTLCFVRYLDDFPFKPSNNIWADTRQSGFSDPKKYVVQTNTRAIEHCMLMTTDPGDLVLDPTCGSGTAAYVAEQWGRRWITIDTSRVAIAIARQRLLTAKYDYYDMRDESAGVSAGLKYRTVPHITLKSIAQSTNLDPIFAKHEPILDEKLAACNGALALIPDDLRRRLAVRLRQIEQQQGKRAVTEADRRRWLLPKKDERWEHWQVPFDTCREWHGDLIHAVEEYRKAWRTKMDEVNACIAANADHEELVDQPEVVKGVARVSGPFTVEAVQPPEMSLGDVEPETIQMDPEFDGAPEEVGPTFQARLVETRVDKEAQNLDAYLEQMTRLLRMDGVRFPNNQQMKFSRLERLDTAEPGLHAEGRWTPEGKTDPDPEGQPTVCVAFGPQYGSVTAKIVEDLIRSANRSGYDVLVVAAFSFDGPAQAVIDEVKHSRLKIHSAHIRPDVNPGMNGLLKEQPGSQLFTVFGQPRVKLDGPDKAGEYTATMEGVDIYNPVDNSIVSTGAEKVAAWFLDGDYDGRTFCITQAFFPDRSAWDKLARALKDVVDESAFEAFSGTESLPFPAGKHKCVAVKVIDPRGNEVMKVERLS